MLYRDIGLYRGYMGIVVGYILGFYGDNGKENGNCYSILGYIRLYRKSLIEFKKLESAFGLVVKAISLQHFHIPIGFLSVVLDTGSRETEA